MARLPSCLGLQHRDATRLERARREEGAWPEAVQCTGFAASVDHEKGIGDVFLVEQGLFVHEQHDLVVEDLDGARRRSGQAA